MSDNRRAKGTGQWHQQRLMADDRRQVLSVASVMLFNKNSDIMTGTRLPDS